MNELNIAAVLIAALTTFVVGGLWYSKALFGAIWTRESQSPAQGRHPGLVFVSAYVLSVIACALLWAHLGAGASWSHGLRFGALVGAGFVATSFGINYAFGGRSVKLFAIDAGYNVLQFAAFGLVLGAWPG
jgi:hypothetical protein